MVSAPRERIPVVVLGATGTVGQRFVALLSEHPWFRLAAVGASQRSEGRPYAAAVDWIQPTPLPPAAGSLEVFGCEPFEGVPLAFSALDAAVAGPLESAWAEAGALVVSNARNHRMQPGVPLLVPEVNADHLDLLPGAARGGIVTNPNCSTVGLVLALAPLHRAFGVEAVSVVTLQALSGAGMPGVPAMRAHDNVIPLIVGEEEKLEQEPLKILGSLQGAHVAPAPIAISAACNRVPVLDGHTLCVSVRLARSVAPEEIRSAWEGFPGVPRHLGLPSAPRHPVCYLDAPDAPQPRLHRDLGGGMTASIGRLRPCPLFGWKFVVLSHNTLRGAAGGAILAAELAVARGLVPGLR